MAPLESIIVLDFGSQYTQLICRKIRELNFYSEILPYNTSITIIQEKMPKGIILSGSPYSIYNKNAPKPDDAIFQLNIPILGICYGMQVIVNYFSGKVEATLKREYGLAQLNINKNSILFNNIPSISKIWMSHGDKIDLLPQGFDCIAKTNSSPYSVISNYSKQIFGLQFHPEVSHTEYGKKILQNFCQKVCQINKKWKLKNVLEKKIANIQNIVQDKKVLLAFSGGVDSFVSAKILYKAIGKNLTCVYVDTGFMRNGETRDVCKVFQNYFSIPLHIIQSSKKFYQQLNGIESPAEKRKIIGKIFVEELTQKSKSIGKYDFLAQGTLYTDIIESADSLGPSEQIKLHHNRAKEICHLISIGKIIEPLKDFFKDEVRKLGKLLELPNEVIYRHPFPGPGLAIRLIGKINLKYLELLKKADTILTEELKKNNIYYKVWQALVVFLPVQSVGVMGDKRTYENVVAIRIVNSVDGMTADFSYLPFDFLSNVSNRIINEIPGINRVVYDISSKPPSTIEWE